MALLPENLSEETNKEILDTLAHDYLESERKKGALTNERLSTLNDSENQQIELREKAVGHAILVCLFLVFYVCIMGMFIAFGKTNSIGEQAQIAIFASPIFALTFITVFILKGVFGSTKNTEMDGATRALTTLSNGQN